MQANHNFSDGSDAGSDAFSEGEGYYLPSIVQDALSDAAHVQDIMNQSNALRRFWREEQERADREEAAREEAEDREALFRFELDRENEQERLYPSDQFILYGTNSSGPTEKYAQVHLKGRVFIPSQEDLIRVEAFALSYSDKGRRDVLLVLRKLQQTNIQQDYQASDHHFLLALCRNCSSILPEEALHWLNKHWDESTSRKPWSWVSTQDSFEAVTIKRKRHELDLNMITSDFIGEDRKNPFKGMVCCNDMVASLRSGIVLLRKPVARKTIVKRKEPPEFGILRQPFAPISDIDCSSIYILRKEVTGMSLFPAVQSESQDALQVCES